MNNVPQGNITFLFTDIEGSTKLAQEFPGTIADSLKIHHSILTNAIEANNGFVFRIVGDAFLSSFENAIDAVKAATKIQTNLSNQKWNDAIIKVRIGIHSGCSDWNGQNYENYLVLEAVKKVMSTAFGEQVLVSGETYDQLKKRINASSSENGQTIQSIKHDDNVFLITDLGERRLKDLVQPVRLYQLRSEAMRQEFPPLKTLDVRPNNLPAQLTTFIGREKELSDIKKLLTGSRLLTITGPGGTGKTRLAHQIGEGEIIMFENGVWLLEFASLNDGKHISREIAAAFKLTADRGKIPDEQILNYLREKEILLILDNCEHLVQDCARISEMLLKNCAHVKIITTSREPLRVEGEVLYHLQSLTLPENGTDVSPELLMQFESAKLFADRSLTVNPAFKIDENNAHAISKLCLELDGIPLAIELAASRSRILSPEKILGRLKDRFSLLTGGTRTSLPRQQTLKATIDWSYDLLTETEKTLWHRMSLFTGGWTLEAAENICADETIDEFEILDVLTNLVDKSLVKVNDSHGNLRYSMLETIRQYGCEKLSSDERLRHSKYQFDYFYKIVKDSEPKLQGTGQKECIIKIKQDYENIRQSLNFANENLNGSGLQMCLLLCKYWEIQGSFQEGIEFIQLALLKSADAEIDLKAKADYWIGYFELQLGNYNSSNIHLHNCLKTFQDIKDRYWEARALHAIGVKAMYEIKYDELREYSTRSLEISRAINNKWLIAGNLQTLASGLLHEEKYDESRKVFTESLDLFRELNDYVNIAKIIGNIGLLEYFLGRYEEALGPLEESLKLRIELNERQGISIALNNLGAVKYTQKKLDEAKELLEESLRITREIGDKRTLVTPLSTLGLILGDRCDHLRALETFKEVIIVANEIDDKYSMAKGFDGFASNLVEINEFEKAVIGLAKYISLFEQSGKKTFIEAEHQRADILKTRIRDKLGDRIEELLTIADDLTVDDAIEQLEMILDAKKAEVHQNI